MTIDSAALARSKQLNSGGPAPTLISQKAALAESDQPLDNRAAVAHERFVAFAFAGAELVVEIDSTGTMTFAAGAFQSKFGRPAEAFVGRPIRDLFAPRDQEMFERSLLLLGETGRLLPTEIELSDPGNSRVALGGLVLAPRAGSTRLCLSLARLPTMAAPSRRPMTARDLAKRVDSHCIAGGPASISFLQFEVQPRPGRRLCRSVTRTGHGGSGDDRPERDRERTRAGAVRSDRARRLGRKSCTDRERAGSGVAGARRCGERLPRPRWTWTARG